VYLFSNDGNFSDYSHYQVMGYTQSDGRYQVYSRFITQMWSAPHGVEGEDYIVIDGRYYVVQHYLKTEVEIRNGRVQFHTWDQFDRMTEEMNRITPLTVFANNETVTIRADRGVFDANTVITIAEPQEEVLQQVAQTLGEEIVDFVAYDITSTAQPNGVAQVTFAIPEGFDPAYLALYHVSEDGVAQLLDAVVNPDAGTMTAELAHFSVYVVAQLPKPLVGDANGDKLVDARDARAILRYLANMMPENELNMTLADVNGDGLVDARDARAILRRLVQEDGE
jgi:hypothetical protein